MLNRAGGPWPGGYVSRKGERLTFIIERRFKGKRYHVSTGCHSLRAAMKQLERFEANPSGYEPEGEEPEGALLMTVALVEEFHAWQVHKKGVSWKHARETCNRLFDWAGELKHRDLRQLTLRQDVGPVLEALVHRPPDERGRKRNRRVMIAPLKVFFGWLRKEKHLLTSAQDPTLDLAVPQVAPEKQKRRKVVEPRVVKATLKQLRGHYRDVLTLLAATGMHVSELERFVRGHTDSTLVITKGARTAKGKRIAAVLVTPMKAPTEKRGRLTRIPLVSKEAVDAAKRLRAYGMVPRRLNHHVKLAAARAEVQPFTLGVMRHSVLTWAKERGATFDELAEFANHADPRTTRKFYVDTAAPTTAVPLPTLH